MAPRKERKYVYYRVGLGWGRGRSRSDRVIEPLPQPLFLCPWVLVNSYFLIRDWGSVSQSGWAPLGAWTACLCIKRMKCSDHPSPSRCKNVYLMSLLAFVLWSPCLHFQIKPLTFVQNTVHYQGDPTLWAWSLAKKAASGSPRPLLCIASPSVSPCFPEHLRHQGSKNWWGLLHVLWHKPQTGWNSVLITVKFWHWREHFS